MAPEEAPDKQKLIQDYLLKKYSPQLSDDEKQSFEDERSAKSMNDNFRMLGGLLGSSGIDRSNKPDPFGAVDSNITDDFGKERAAKRQVVMDAIMAQKEQEGSAKSAADVVNTTAQTGLFGAQAAKAQAEADQIGQPKTLSALDQSVIDLNNAKAKEALTKGTEPAKDSAEGIEFKKEKAKSLQKYESEDRDSLVKAKQALADSQKLIRKSMNNDTISITGPGQAALRSVFGDTAMNAAKPEMAQLRQNMTTVVLPAMAALKGSMSDADREFIIKSQFDDTMSPKLALVQMNKIDKIMTDAMARKDSELSQFKQSGYKFGAPAASTSMEATVSPNKPAWAK